MRTLRVVLICLAAAAFASAAEKPVVKAATVASRTAAAAPARLPVTRVVLYKNGIGYFEHFGRVQGNEEVTVEFTTAQLNDVLKSLTVVDLGNGRVTGIRYNSIAPLSERLRALRVPVGDNPTRAQFLAALRGARVEVRSGAGSAVGRILSVEHTERLGANGEKAGLDQLTVVTDAGETRSFDLTPATSVRLLERELSEDVSRYLTVLASAREQDMRRMTISTSGSGGRDLYVGYLSEVPVWKSTYRIILSSKLERKPILQGWAIVDNTIGEDWNGVQLSLVSGAPQSFIQELSQPYYVRRPVVPMPEAFELTPQTHEGTIEEPTAVPAIAMPGPPPPPPPGVAGGVIAGGIVGEPVSNTFGAEYGRNTGTAYYFSAGAGLFGTVKDPMGAVIAGATVTLTDTNTGQSQSTSTNAQGMYRFRMVPSGNSQLRVDASNFQSMVVRLAPGAGRRDVMLNVGAATETVEVEDRTRGVLVSKAISDLETETASGEVGDLFEYDLKQKITILKNQSALVPIAQSPIEAEKVTLWSGDEDAAPLRALWVTNTSGLTLDAGTFNVLEDDTFAGEGLLETIKPAERRLLSYAVDQSVRISAKEEGEEEPISRVSVLKGVMKITREERETKTYTVRNSDTSARSVILEHPVRDDWKLMGDLKPEEASATHYRFRVNVAPGTTEKLVVTESHPLETQYALTNLTSKDVELWAQQKKLTPEMEQAFGRVLAQKNVVSGLDAQMRAAQQQVESITVDQGRLRENMKALKGSAEERALLQRYTRELNSQEDQLDKLRSELADLRGKRAQAAAELDRIIQEIALEASF